MLVVLSHLLLILKDNGYGLKGEDSKEFPQAAQ